MQYLRAVHTCGTDEYFLEVVEAPAWAKAVSWLVDELDHRTGHVLCGDSGPDAWWYAPVQGALYSLFGWALFLPDRREEVVQRIPTTLEWAQAFGYAQLPEEDEED